MGGIPCMSYQAPTWGMVKLAVWAVRKGWRTNRLCRLARLFVVGLGWTAVEVKRATSIIRDHPTRDWSRWGVYLLLYIVCNGKVRQKDIPYTPSSFTNLPQMVYLLLKWSIHPWRTVKWETKDAGATDSPFMFSLPKAWYVSVKRR